MPSLKCNDPRGNKNGHIKDGGSWQRGSPRILPSSNGGGLDPLPKRSTSPEQDRTSSSDGERAEESSIFCSDVPTTRIQPTVGFLSGQGPIGDVTTKLSLPTPRRISTHTTSDEYVETKTVQAETALVGTNQAKWEKSFQRLKEFKALYGHCRVPSKLDRPLSVWVNNQRYQLHANRRCRNKQDRIDRLDSLGFDWGCAHPNSSNHDVSMKGSFVDDPKQHEGNLPNDVVSEDLAVGRVERLTHDSEAMDCATTILALSSAGTPKSQGRNGPSVHEPHNTHAHNGFKRTGVIVPSCGNNDWATNQPLRSSHALHQRINRLNSMHYLWTNRAFFNGPTYVAKNPPHAWSMNRTTSSEIQDVPADNTKSDLITSEARPALRVEIQILPVPWLKQSGNKGISKNRLLTKAVLTSMKSIGSNLLNA